MQVVYLVLWFILGPISATTDVSSCSCGFFDPRSGAVWTDAIISYANETVELPADALLAEDFQHPYEKNWNARYRAGASAANLGHNESTAPGWTGNAWTMNMDRPTREHAVVGTSIRSLRRDIRYGSFEAALGPPRPGVGGSIVALTLDYNETQTININVMNADDPKDAWTSFMMYGDWRGDRSKGVNFTDFGNSSYNYPTSPWGLVGYRVEWTREQADYFIGDAVVRSVRPREMAKGWPITASTLVLSHLSIGDAYTSEGPPPNGSYAHVGMIRAFFNSSIMSVVEHAAFDARCREQVQCLVTDTQLRGSSPCQQAAMVVFTEPSIDYIKRWPAIFVASICIAISTVLLIHAGIKRAPWKSKSKSDHDGNGAAAKSSPNDAAGSAPVSATPSIYFSEGYGLTDAAQTPGFGTPGAITPGWATPGGRGVGGGGEGAYFGRAVSSWASETLSAPGRNTRSERSSMEITPISHDTSRYVNEKQPQHAGRFVESITDSSSVGENKSSKLNITVNVTDLDLDTSRPTTMATTTSATKTPTENKTTAIIPAKPPIAPTRARVDYLAGLVAMASILVTLIHFCLTFLPATEIPYTHAHYKSELWALKIVSPYLLTFSWIGPFFTSSTRFLVMTYLKSGNLRGIAEKAVGRTPRLIIPCAAMAALEYFCMQVGAITWLEYLPSVTWSTWPYTSNYVTFGHFISEVIELMYIIPNAVPQITFNYCIGVLWTIPVQLQNSWTSLLAVIIIREIKTPWKRMSYYAFCIVMHWYAMSWGSFFWVGLLIADLDISYKWKTWLYARPLVYYPFLTFIVLLALGSPSMDLLGQWTSINISTLEYGIHPHQRTGNIVRQTSDYGYPPYYLPRLTALTFSIGFHLLVELSPLVQKFFSNPFFMWLFPHILTLYLIHGLIFWSLGSVICVHLSAHGIPYWANMLVVATCCYTVIFGCLPFMTPVLETLGKSITVNIWRDASEKPAKRRKTLYPFSPDMFKDGEKNETEIVETSDDVEKHTNTVVIKTM